MFFAREGGAGAVVDTGAGVPSPSAPADGGGRRLLGHVAALALFMLVSLLEPPARRSSGARVERAPSLPLASVPPRLAVIILAGKTETDDPSPAVRAFVGSYSGSPYDLFVLHEGMRAPIAAIASVVPSVTFVDVTEFFNPVLLYAQRGIFPGITCSGGGKGWLPGYRLMCRFMSGPVYWLPELDAYDQVLRIDQDSLFTAPITHSLALQGNETYAYARLQTDDAECQLGFPELVRRQYEGAPEVLRFGSNAWSAPWERTLGIYNCNFEVASLLRFRSQHYRAFWEAVDEEGLFYSTRLGDHEVKTVYVETFEPEAHVVCYADLPYSHPGDALDARGPCGAPNLAGRVRSYASQPPGRRGQRVVTS